MSLVFLFPGKRYDFDDDGNLELIKIIRGGEFNLVTLLVLIFPKLVKILPRNVRKNWLNADHFANMKAETHKIAKARKIHSLLSCHNSRQ